MPDKISIASLDGRLPQSKAARGTSNELAALRVLYLAATSRGLSRSDLIGNIDQPDSTPQRGRQSGQVPYKVREVVKPPILIVGCSAIRLLLNPECRGLRHNGRPHSTRQFNPNLPAFQPDASGSLHFFALWSPFPISDYYYEGSAPPHGLPAGRGPWRLVGRLQARQLPVA